MYAQPYIVLNILFFTQTKLHEKGEIQILSRLYNPTTRCAVLKPIYAAVCL